MAYETRDTNDLEAVIAYIQRNGAELDIDVNRLSLFATFSIGNLESFFTNLKNNEYLKFTVYFCAGVELPNYPWHTANADLCKVWLFPLARHKTWGAADAYKDR